MRLPINLRLFISIILFLAAVPMLGSDEPFASRFLSIEGRNFTIAGQQIHLKGSSYYPKDAPWAHMWKRWNGPAVQQELETARSMGINTVRVLIPYHGNTGWTDDKGNVNEEYLSRLREFVQLAGEQDIKVQITLFDFYGGFDAGGTPENAAAVSYLRTIVGAFKDDDRVLAWDLHNEPDQYSEWREGREVKVIDWLARMAQEVKSIDHQHPITIGMRKAANLWVEGPRGATAADISDFISFHSYDTVSIRKDIAEIKSRTVKPVVLQEMGWPTGPDCWHKGYDEETQAFLYRTMLQAAEEEQLAGVLQWSLFDYTLYRSADYDNEADHYGLIRLDGSEKPAAYIFENLYPASSLRSHSMSQIPLTTAVIPETDSITQGDKDSIFFDETGKSIRGFFKAYWITNGGKDTLGLPLTEALHEDNLIVQYFEHGRLERDDRLNMKELAKLPPGKQIKRVVRLSRLEGREYLEQQGNCATSPIPQAILQGEGQ